MTIVADQYRHVIGIDTHAATHTYAIVDTVTGAVLDTATFPVTKPGFTRAIGWIRARTGTGPILAAVEGTSSYGATLTGALERDGIPVVEAKPPKRATRRAAGKSDRIDAIAAARTVMGTEIEELIHPRAEGIRSALRVLLVARRAIDSRCTADRNMLTALLRSFDLGIDVRKALTDAQVATVAAWRPRKSDDPATVTIRAEAHRLAAAVITGAAELEHNMTGLHAHVRELAPELLKIFGVGPFVAAILITTYSHPGRIRSEAAFAHLAGAAPIPASSGKTNRHRLNRYGDRQLNRALHIIVRTRLDHDAATRAYAERRSNQGTPDNEIKRLLKRYVARQIFRKLGTIMA
jgi:transposase